MVRCGSSFTANDTASLKTSRFTWNFTKSPLSALETLGRSMLSGADVALGGPRIDKVVECP
ncbi:hypothetical protein GCM10009851_07780 [Herbiconiux moechotypicola]|uniref:Uncharacterized protein n=1 Tax=Herbiconiux moechotypicola TaxID=637393 RepID=A0ABN3DAU7_9MICO